MEGSILRMKIEFMSGVFGALVSTTIMQPVDIARNRTSVQFVSKIQEKYKGFGHTFYTILKEEGLKGFYTGYSASIISNPIYYSIFFVGYEASKIKLKKYLYNNEQLDNNQKCFLNSVSSMIGALMAGTITNPLWIAKLRIQTQRLNQHSKYDGLIPTLRLIYQEEGIRNGLFKGMTISYIGLVHPMLYFPIYEQMKSKFTNNHEKQITSYQITVCSAISKIIALTMTYPHVIVRNRIQFQPHENSNQAIKLIKHIATTTYKKQGVKGFYAGLSFEMFRVLPQNTIVFQIYELTKAKLFEYYNIH